ncbi:hypothetical protein VTN77DRAFT_9158 [Rasamsonia byssochlamydoides]|uniref:uncharacterized protein n=1 Tax=Rasamsonia byssochlamydoides TaxID=89139 RepID=UPI0037425A79
MAPRKGKAEKSEKSAPGDGAAMILEYLRKQNRPYSAIDISTNLHNKVTKTSAVKTLKELHERKEIEGRAAGKQLVYHTLQDLSEVDTPETIAAVDEEIQQIQNELSDVKIREKELREKLAVVCAIIPMTELCDSVSKLEEEKAASLDRLSKLQEQGTVCISVEEMTRVEKEWKTWQNHVQTRRRIFHELWARCTEVLPEDTTEEDLKETLGLEGSF